ncbi:AAA family ATPase [Mycoplasma sp. Ms02]|uniref:AAA family ATPase n=1 Tax=Mycoplasma sp. Ms02 TaxID=353851 RepID=UPI001C8A781C|nr:AAA family ATPase [Mycoplasma sp. Ms02]QZE12296.1 AAA family ATPase [Mycoplasma sp. Ms02]
MKLIKVEAHGFKSFADPISLNFDGGVAGVVGPNGSGKSNINDAIKWVLGEQSSRELRGDSMEDVIFAGSKTTPAMNKAEVTLTFDNRAKTSSFDTDFVTITRVIKRGKGSEYLINGLPSRQRDIKSLAMETGIGKSSLAIISQGTVSDIAEATDEERKYIFEEAAGVSKYKHNKKESEKKLEKTEEGIEKIEIVIFELEKQLNPLRKKAEKASIYLEKSAQLKDVEIALLAYQIEQYTEKVSSLSKEIEGVEEARSDYNTRIDEIDSQIKAHNTLKSELKSRISELRHARDILKDKIKQYEIAEAQNKERQKLITQGLIQVSSSEQISSFIQRLEELKARINHDRSEEEKYKKILEAASNEETTLSTKINDLESQKKVEAQKVASIQARLDVYKEQKESGANLFKGTKTVLSNKHHFKGVRNIVSELIKVENTYAQAIETILGAALQHVVVDSSETAVNVVNFLKRNNGGRATFIPLNTIQPKFIREDHLIAIQSQKGVVGIASDLVQMEPKLDILKKYLLGNVIVAETIDFANSVAKVMDNRYMVVSLDGDVVRPGGVIVGGESAKGNNSLLNADDKIKELENLLPQIKLSMSEKTEAINKLLSDRSVQSEYKFKTSNKLSEIRQTINQNQNEYNETKQRLSSITNEEIKIKESLSQAEANMQLVKSKLSEIEIEHEAKSAAYEQLESDINTLRIKVDGLRYSLKELEKNFGTNIAENARLKMLLEQAQDRIVHHYKITFEHAKENYKLELPLDQAIDFVDNLKAEIEELGNVDIDSIELFKEVEDKYNNYTRDRDELVEAKRIIVSAIAEMDKIIVTRLTQIVHDVNEEFNNVFTTMFGGGSAHIEFTDKSDILESGISISAQPPGKSVKNLKLFSGGEKSLIAISLLFGILKARPLPLCILDEVEAALDEANVVRYAEYLQALKEKTQFLVITHRHGTMSRVDQLFGATMQKRGVTSFFTLELAQAKELVEDTQQEVQ